MPTFGYLWRVADSVIGFDPVSYSADEGAPVTLTVTRTMGTAGAVSVDWTASGGLGSGSLDWAALDGSIRVIEVTAGASNFTVTLSGLTGDAVLGEDVAVVTVTAGGGG